MWCNGDIVSLKGIALGAHPLTKAQRRWAHQCAIRVVPILSLLLFASLCFSLRLAGHPLGIGHEPALDNYLVSNAPTTTFRFLVAHDHFLGSWSRFCLGYLLLTEDEIRYEVLRPTETKDHGFRLSRRSILSAGKWRGMGPSTAAEFKFEGDKVYRFYLIHEATLDKSPYSLLKKEDVLSWPPVARLAMRFEEVAAQVQPPPKTETKIQQDQITQRPQNPTPAAKPEGPKVRLMEPLLDDPTVPVEVTQPVLTLRGAAIDPRGVLSVAVGDRQAELRAAGDITAVEFSMKDLKLGEGLNRLRVVATNVDHQSTELSFLLWLRSKSDSLTSVTPPTPGTGMQPPAPKPLNEAQILELLNGQVPSKRIAKLVKEHGIDFEPSEDYLDTVRKSGGERSLLEALRKAKRVMASAAVETAAPH